MSDVVCRGGYANLGGRCLPVRGKAAKKAKHAIYSGKPSGTHTAMESNEAKQEVRGTRKPNAEISRGAWSGQEMDKVGGSSVMGGADDRFHQRHGDRMTNMNMPRGRNNATVTGGTGFRKGTPSNAEQHIITNPQKKGVTPKVMNSGRKRKRTDAGNMYDMKRVIKGNGEFGSNKMPSNGGTGGGEAPYHGYHKDSMGSKKARGFLKKRRQRDGHNAGFLNHRRDAF